MQLGEHGPFGFIEGGVRVAAATGQEGVADLGGLVGEDELGSGPAVEVVAVRRAAPPGPSGTNPCQTPSVFSAAPTAWNEPPLGP